MSRMLLLIGLSWLLAACAPPPPPPTPAPTATALWQNDLAEVQQRQSQRTPEIEAQIRYWRAGPLARWNELACELVAKNSVTPPQAARLFAVLSLAQQAALEQLDAAGLLKQWRPPRDLDSTLNVLADATDNLPLEAAALAGASAEVLHQLLPKSDEQTLAALHEHVESYVWAGVALRGDLARAQQLGQQAAQTVLARVKDDGAAQGNEPVPWPADSGKWQPNEVGLPTVPSWSRVRPMLLTSADQFRAAPPPAFDSPEFKVALAEVRQVSDTRTPEQLRLARDWSDSPGTITPPGHWNQIALDLIQRYRLDERQATQVLSTLNMAMFDAGIAAWDSKYHYFVIRPWQADDKITLPVGKPDHPSYPSGHSTFSGAAAQVLSYFFPAEQAALWRQASDASLSRLYGGIHYRFDLEAGEKMGRAVGDLAVQYARRQNWLSPVTP